MKALSKLNKLYWKKVPANKTTSSNIWPSNEMLVRVPAKGFILDAGCGDGQLSEWFSKKDFLVNAIDINKNAIENCKKNNTKVNYSTQDITKRTKFKSNCLDLICFRFTLTNIHRNEWSALRKEIDRLVSPEGFIWLAEPLVSSDYQKRYELSKRLLNDKYAIFVFKNPDTARNITTTNQLKVALDKKEISRISRHYTKKELMNLFPTFEIIKEKIVKITSPSGFTMNTFTGLLKRKAN